MGIATAVEVVTTLLTVGGLVYMLLALWGARDFEHSWRRTVRASASGSGAGFAPDVSILKPLKGVDARMYAGFVSHCAQQYAGRFEILFGVSSMDDPAAAQIEHLRAEFPACAIRLIVCPERLGTSGKVSNLIQMLRQASYDYVLINDSDIRVSPNYLTRVMGCFQPQPAKLAGDPDSDGAPAAVPVGMVTVPYLGRTAAEGHGLTLWARLEALGISTDFLPGVLTARKIEGGIRFGLGSTLAVERKALAAAGGLEPLVDYLADDYEIGVRIVRRDGGDDRARVRLPRLLGPSIALGAVHARFAALGLCGAGDYLLHSVGGAELRGLGLCAVELHPAEPGAAGAGVGGADGGRGRAAR
jgi:ceramide glucosyltransferase